MDFQQIKKAVSLVAAAEMLQLSFQSHGGQLRGLCPACGSDNKRALVITPDKGFYCFTAKKGGDQISLVAHVLGIGLRQAAMWLQEQEGITVPPKAPPKAAKADTTASPLHRIAERLDPAHESVAALGLDPETAAEHGIGFDEKGMMRGRVCFPLYKAGQLAGFVGFDPEDGTLKVPNLSTVVAFKRKAS